MKPHRTKSAQGSFLLPDLGTQLDPRQALYRLAKAIDWKFFEEAFGPLYSAERLRGQELILDILYWFFLQWEKFVRDYDLKGGEEAEWHFEIL